MPSKEPRPPRFRAGDAVVVRTADEILATLDAHGTLGGLPFMPEMLAWCGQSFRVTRRVDKTCIEVADTSIYSNRRFAGDDVVLLDGPRCHGAAHDGCNRGCRIFWREAWLRHADGASAAPNGAAAIEALRARLRVQQGGDRWFCQSTELLRATEEFPGRKKPWLLRIAARAVRRGELGAGTVLAMFTRWALVLLRRQAGIDTTLRGANARTPQVALGLQPGDLVRIRTRAEIEGTLDGNGRNRGMGINPEMARLCGLEAEVRCRVERIIDERTGIMRPLRHTVILRNARGAGNACEECLCSAQPGDCARGELMYWREAWLERAGTTSRD